MKENNMILAFLKKFYESDKMIFFFLFAIFFFGFIMILQQACASIVRYSNLEVLDGIIGFFPSTRKYIIWYIVSVPSVFLLWLSAIFYRKFFRQKLISFFALLRVKKIMPVYMLAVLLLNTLFIASDYGSGNTWLMFLSIWAIAYFFPLLLPSSKTLNSFFNSSFAQKYFYIAVMAACLIYFGWMLKPFVFDKLKIMNEYWDIPTETLLQDGTTFDNTEYINKNKLIGFHHKYDIRKENDKPETIYANVRNTYDLKQYTQYATKQERLVSPFFYEEGKGLSLVLPLQDKYRAGLLELDWTNTERNSLSDAFIIVDDENKYLKKNKEKTLYGINTSKFIKNNNLALHWQIFNRWYIHHHNHIMGAVNELALGRPANEIFMQYGFLNAYFIQKVLSAAGQVNYGAYEKLVYSFYIFYFFLASLIVWFITRKIHYVAIFMLATIASFNLLSFQFFYLGPGLNPVRHFFDFPLFLFLYMYFVKQKRIYYYLCLLTSLVAILNNTQFGFILMLSLFMAIFIKQILESKFKIFGIETMSSVLAFCLGIIIALTFQQGSAKVTTSFLSGLLSFPVPAPAIIITLTTLFICYYVFTVIRKFDKPMAYLFFTVLIYSQGLLVFWFRSYFSYHILVFAMIYVLLFIIPAKVLLDKRNESENKILFSLTLILFLLFIISMSVYTKPLRAFNRVLNNHTLYEWTFPGTNFISDMNPAYFEDSAELIKKYSTDNKGIYIISKYDNFLPLISGRYSALPVIDFQWYVITKSDYEEMINFFKLKSPKYIFVDRDFASRNFEYDIINCDSSLGNLYEESYARVQRLKNMQEIAEKVTGEGYNKLESSLLLTVYERKDSK